MTLKNNTLVLLLIALIASVIFIPFIGNCPLFDWDEVNFAECAREMVVSGNYSHVQLNFRPFWEKPPFFIWLQAISMNLFGVNEFAARFPNAICSIVTFITLYLAGKKFHSQKFGVMWVLLYAATLLPHLYFKSGLIDPWFNLFIFLSLYNCIGFINNPTGENESRKAALAGLFLGIAVLTKGPVALVIVALTVTGYYAWTRGLQKMISKPMIIFIVSSLVVSLSWFLVELVKGNSAIIREFIEYQVRLFETGDAGHDGPFYYHILVLLVGCFPASILFIASYFKYTELTPYQRLFRKVMLSLFWVVLILFSVVKTKIIHYSSLCYFPLTFVAAIGLVQYFESIVLSKWMRSLYWIITIVFTIAFVLIGFTEHIKGFIISKGLIGDEFAVKNLESEVSWNGFEFLIGFVFLAGSVLVFHSLKRRNVRLLITGLIVNLAFIYLAIVAIIPKVELYSQHAAIEFYKACAGRNCYVETHAFKSYAYLFYSDRRKSDYTNPYQIAYIENQLNIMEKEGHSRLASFATANNFWMENGIIDRPAFIVSKITSEEDLLKKPELHRLYEKNGFSFYVRMPSKTPIPAK